MLVLHRPLEPAPKHPTFKRHSTAPSATSVEFTQLDLALLDAKILDHRGQCTLQTLGENHGLSPAKVLNAPYEAQANVQMAKNAGLSSAEIDAAATDGSVSGINPEYVLVCKATDELSKSGTLRDETLRELLDRYGETVSRKIVLMIGWFNMLSLFLNGCRVPLETTDKVGTRTSPLG